ncbi:MAG: hypothetical protein IT257_02820, partial [Chitinophagaceae bacterium]|nr:hypothetical protein [Chitinophagaceae bacterium]
GEVLVVYLPVLMSKDYKDYGKSIFGQKRFENTMTFALNLGKLNMLKTQEVMNMFGL